MQSISTSGSIGEDCNELVGLHNMLRVDFLIPKCAMLQGAQVCAVCSMCEHLKYVFLPCVSESLLAK
jgi:hypothetical protein